LGYRHAAACLLDGVSPDEAEEALVRDTAAFARRQILLFKKIPGLVWFHGDDLTGLKRYFSGITAGAVALTDGGLA
jgi:tRNA A37 N6-isopentenylltransferase MiaA